MKRWPLWLLTVLVSMVLGGAVVYAFTMGAASSHLKVAQESTAAIVTEATANGARLDDLSTTLDTQAKDIGQMLDLKLTTLGWQKVGTK
jgi:hypothetical protein